MRKFFATSSALAARLLLIVPLISQSYSATTTVQVQKGDSFSQIAQEHGVSVQSLEAANPGVEATSLYVGQTINVPVVNDVPAVDDTVTTLVFASSQTAKAASPTTSATSSNDVPAMSDVVTGSLIFASSGSQTAKAATPTTSATSSNDIPAMSDVVTGSLVFASSGSKTSEAATALFKPTSDDVPAMSDVVTGSIVLASGSQTGKAMTPTTLITSSRPPASSSAPPPPPPPPSSSPPPSSTPPPPLSSTPSPPPSTSSTTPTASTTTPNSPASPVSCAPTPTGKYYDATSVRSKTDAFCAQYGDLNMYDLDNTAAGGGHLINGDSQDGNKDHGSTNDEKGYNMTVEMLFDGCWVQDATVMNPLPRTPEFNCTGLLYSTYGSCTANDGMGGSVTAGCFVYTFLPDP